MRERLRQHDHWLEKAVAIDGIYGVGLLVMGFLGLVNKAAFDSAVDGKTRMKTILSMGAGMKIIALSGFLASIGWILIALIIGPALGKFQFPEAPASIWILPFPDFIFGLVFASFMGLAIGSWLEASSPSS